MGTALNKPRFSFLVATTLVPTLWFADVWPFASATALLATAVLFAVNWVLLLILILAIAFISRFVLPDRLNPIWRFGEWLVD